MEEHELWCKWESEAAVNPPPQDLIAWLATQTPETWHAIASAWTYDSGCAPLLWIVQQPTCDFATGLTIFGVEGVNWITTPTWQELSHKDYQDSWKMCDIIVKRWIEDSFGSAEFTLASSSKGLEAYRIMEQRYSAAGKAITWDVPAFVDGYPGNRQAMSYVTWMNGALYWDFEVWKKQHIHQDLHG